MIVMKKKEWTVDILSRTHPAIGVRKPYHFASSSTTERTKSFYVIYIYPLLIKIHLFVHKVGTPESLVLWLHIVLTPSLSLHNAYLESRLSRDDRGASRRVYPRTTSIGKIRHNLTSEGNLDFTLKATSPCNWNKCIFFSLSFFLSFFTCELMIYI